MTSPSFRLDGSCALVTGAATGIGAVIAEALAEAGADVACHGNRRAPDDTLERVRKLGRHAVAFLAQLTKALGNEWAARGINVNAIAPGYARTDNTAALQADATRSRQILERIPAGRWGEPGDLGGAAVFPCSPAASYVLGHVLAVDGGWLGR